MDFRDRGSPAWWKSKNRLDRPARGRDATVVKYLPAIRRCRSSNLRSKMRARPSTAQRARVIETVKNDYQTTAVAEERSFAASLEQQKTEAMDLDRKSGGYIVLERQAEGDRSSGKSLLQQQKELQVVSNSRSNNVQVMDRAEVPGAPFSPNHAARLVHGDDGRHARRRSGCAFGSSTSTTRSRRPKTCSTAAACRCSAWCRRSAAIGCRCCRNGAARFRRGVPLAADVARVHPARRDSA